MNYKKSKTSFNIKAGKMGLKSRQPGALIEGMNAKKLFKEEGMAHEKAESPKKEAKEDMKLAKKIDKAKTKLEGKTAKNDIKSIKVKYKMSTGAKLCLKSSGIKTSGSFQGKSNKLGYGGRAAQLKAQGVPGGVIGNLARAAKAAPGMKNYHGKKMKCS